MNRKVLFVDDDPEILLSFERYLKQDFEVFTASSGDQAFQLTQAEGPFAVVVANMHMPGMDGIQFLSIMENRYPNTSRVMLTGRADLQVAMDAVNNGHIYRFLTKPCSNEIIIKVLEAGIKQYQLEIVERELLEQTLHGSINLIVEILRLSHPGLVSRTNRVKKIVQHIIREMKLRNGWQYELALTLSQIGYLAFHGDPIETIMTQDNFSSGGKRVYRERCQIGSQILSHIPRMENIAGMIEILWKPFDEYPDTPKSVQQEFVELGAQIIRLSFDLDTQCMKGSPVYRAIEELTQREGVYNPELLAVLRNFTTSPGDWSRIFVGVEALKTGMIADQDIYRKDGTLMLSKNEEITGLALKHLQSLHTQNLLKEPFYVLVR